MVLPITVPKQNQQFIFFNNNISNKKICHFTSTSSVNSGDQGLLPDCCMK